MSGVERILGVQALVSQWTCKLRDDEVIFSMGPVQMDRITGKLKVCWLYLPFQRVASYLQYWTNMNHAVFIRSFHNLTASTFQKPRSVLSWPAMSTIQQWFGSEFDIQWIQSKPVIFSMATTSIWWQITGMLGVFSLWNPGDPTLRRSSSTWFGTWSGMRWRVKASAPSAPRRNDHSDR